MSNAMARGKGNSLSPEPCVLIPNLSHACRSTDGQSDQQQPTLPARSPMHAEHNGGAA